jgi:5-formyltetrahydrofolate cyclo-ligase|tara:strand:- start:117 stop:668 length:552 start_codon:yes stop_codon:yes gene_type:complete
MQQKIKLRKKYLILRKKKYHEVDKNFFLPLLKLIRFRQKKKITKIALYYPSNLELNVLKILEFNNILRQDILLPVINKKNYMNFFSWKKNDVLFVNEFGMLEPAKTHIKVPDIMLVPILAFDKNKYRLGYGKGFYDRYLNKYLKQFKNILTVGVAFSFQRHHKLPIKQNDVKLDFIITEKGIY